MIKKTIFLIVIIFFFSGCEGIFQDDKIYGCLDDSACNYSDNANTHDQSLCEFPLENFNCSSDCIVEFDECGICGGTGVDVDADGICDDLDPCIGVSNDDGYYCSDLQVLFDFINVNPVLDTMGIEVFDIGSEIGITDWESGRLIDLRLANLNLTSVPFSIGTLNSLELLYLNNNDLTSLPESICDLPSSCEIFLQYNNLCEEYNEYPYDCINHFQEETQNCDN